MEEIGFSCPMTKDAKIIINRVLEPYEMSIWDLETLRFENITLLQA